MSTHKFSPINHTNPLFLTTYSKTKLVLFAGILWAAVTNSSNPIKIAAERCILDSLSVAAQPFRVE